MRAQVYSIWKPVGVLSVKNMQFSVALSREIYKDKGRMSVSFVLKNTCEAKICKTNIDACLILLMKARRGPLPHFLPKLSFHFTTDVARG